MRAVEFQLMNKGVFRGYTNDVIFNGSPAIFIGENERAILLRHIAGQVGQEELHEGLWRDISSVKMNASDGLIPIWGKPVRIIDQVQIIEFEDRGIINSVDQAKKAGINGHYLDLVINNVRDLPFERPRMSKEHSDVMITNRGVYGTMQEAILRANLMGFSDRRALRPDIQQDHDVQQAHVFERRYKDPRYKVKTLDTYIVGVPREVQVSTTGYAKKWAQSVLRSAMDAEPETHWYLDTIPLEILIRKEAAKLTEQ